MSQKRLQTKESAYRKNQILSRSPEQTRKYQTKCQVLNKANKAGYSSRINLLKQTESSLMTENQEIYKFKYSLEEKADDTNIIFFDSNSRKFRIRSPKKENITKQFIQSNNRNPNIKIDQYNTNNSRKNNIISNSKSTKNYLINKKNNNDKRGITIENSSNKINLIKINDKSMRNSKSRTEVIKQLKNEKEELLGKSASSNKNIQIKTLNNKNIDNNVSNKQYIQKNIIKDYKISNKPSNNVQKISLQNKRDYRINKNINSENKQKYQQIQNDANKYSTNKNTNFKEEQTKNQTIETSERKEQRTIILVPGQTIEKKSVVENFENPTEEIIENPDGTFSSIIKQTKVTTVTENIPIEGKKIKTLEGAPELPMYKQQMTHYYKTITSVSPKSGKNNNINNSINNPNINSYKNNIDFNNNIGSSNNRNNKDEIIKNSINNSVNNNKDANNNNKNIDMNNEDVNNNIDKNINKNINKEGKIQDIINKKDVQNNKEKGKVNDFDKSKSSKDFKNGKEIENFLDPINNKEYKISPEEKEKLINSIKDVFDNLKKSGGTEEDLEKLSQILSNMNENDRKLIIQQLEKDSKNSDLIKKLKNSIEKNFSKNNLSQNDDYNYNKGISSIKKYESGNKSLQSENIDIKEINPLKYDGLFLDISGFNNERKEKNPFEGPSPYIEFYKERRVKIKEKIDRLSFGRVGQIEKADIKLKESI